MSTASSTAIRSEPEIADGAAEVAVLSHLLDAHPRRMTVAQLDRELAGRCDGGAVRRAVRNLSAASLLVAGHELAVSQAFAQLVL